MYARYIYSVLGFQGHCDVSRLGCTAMAYTCSYIGVCGHIKRSMKTQCTFANIHLIGPADLPSFECLAPKASNSLQDSANVARCSFRWTSLNLRVESIQLKTRRTPGIDAKKSRPLHHLYHVITNNARESSLWIHDIWSRDIFLTICQLNTSNERWC